MKNDEYEILFNFSRVKAAQIRESLFSWSKVNLRDFPWRKDRTPFSILIAEVLLRRTTATAVFRIYSSFVSQYGDLAKILSSKEADIEAMLSTIGYHKQRAKILKEIAQFLADELNSVVPCSREELLKIPHVGSYTAGAILSLGCGQPSAMVDTNVKRVYGRIFLHNIPKKSKTRFIEHLAAEFLPQENHQLFNLALLDFAALICRYGTPKCKICPISETCDFFADNKPK